MIYDLNYIATEGSAQDLVSKIFQNETSTADLCLNYQLVWRCLRGLTVLNAHLFLCCSLLPVHSEQPVKERIAHKNRTLPISVFELHSMFLQFSSDQIPPALGCLSLRWTVKTLPSGLLSAKCHSSVSKVRGPFSISHVASGRFMSPLPLIHLSLL
jgi:hypothetical protein